MGFSKGGVVCGWVEGVEEWMGRGKGTLRTSSSTLALYASSPAGAAEGGIARSSFCCAVVWMLLRR